MSKYDPLWEYVAENVALPIKLGFDDIRSILGFEIDHSFLTYKKEAETYGFTVRKISLKERTVFFEKL